uniref:Uncharacterized protein n=1 Tax=Peronospora matthiolae TaxID=2874970 RepID=A0AAV1UNS3_9STRA
MDGRTRSHHRKACPRKLHPPLGGELGGTTGGGYPGAASLDGQAPVDPNQLMGSPPLEQPAPTDTGSSTHTGLTGRICGEGGHPLNASGASPMMRLTSETSVRTPAQPSLTSSEMFTALVEKMAESPQVRPVQAWCDRIRHLFAEVYHAVPVRLEDLLAERKRFPPLNAAEAGLLLNLFEQAHVTRRGSYLEWKKMSSAITREHLRIPSGV